LWRGESKSRARHAHPQADRARPTPGLIRPHLRAGGRKGLPTLAKLHPPGCGEGAPPRPGSKTEPGARPRVLQVCGELSSVNFLVLPPFSGGRQGRSGPL